MEIKRLSAIPLTLALLILGAISVGSPLVQAQDTTPPTLESATTSRDGIEVILTFSEDLAVSSHISTLAERYNVPEYKILKDGMTVTVDGRDNVLLSASYSGSVLTLRLETTQVLEGQEVKVAYNNIFATEPGGALTDTVGNAVEPFDLQTVANASEDDNSIDYIGPPVLSQQTLTLCEGDDGDYGVSLPSQPDGNIGVGTLFTPWDMVLPSPEYVSFTQDNWDTNKTITALTAVDDDSYANWAMIYHRIDGVDEAETYDSVVRILILEQDHADPAPVAGL